MVTWTFTIKYRKALQSLQASSHRLSRESCSCLCEPPKLPISCHEWRPETGATVEVFSKTGRKLNSQHKKHRKTLCIDMWSLHGDWDCLTLEAKSKLLELSFGHLGKDKRVSMKSRRWRTSFWENWASEVFVRARCTIAEDFSGLSSVFCCFLVVLACYSCWLLFLSLIVVPASSYCSSGWLLLVADGCC